MTESLDHLLLPRLDPTTPRRKKNGFGRTRRPDDPRQHATHLLEELAAAAQRQAAQEAFDPRLLLKLRVEPGFAPSLFESIPGLRVVSQEDRAVVVAFVDDEAKATFQHRGRTSPTCRSVCTLSSRRESRCASASGLALGDDRDTVLGTLTTGARPQ